MQQPRPASPWIAALRRLDRLRAGPAVGLGVALGALAGVFLATSQKPLAWAAFAGVLLLATVLALTAEPVAEETTPAPPPEPRSGEEREHPADGSVLVYVPAGTYTLGADDLEPFFAQHYTADNAKEFAGRSKPVHTVRLTGFWIHKYPVTHEQYARFLEANPEQPKPRYWDDERFNADSQPVVGVGWEEARAYCRWAGLDLPTEAQWEAAARGHDRWRYPWGDEPPDETRACFGQDWDQGKPSPVKDHPRGAGPYGTCDQAGNVWEWCLDAWDSEAYAERDGATDPVVEGDAGAARVLRGGSWDYPAPDLVSAVRGWYGPSFRGRFIGFRCVWSFPAEP